jgi:hypothetical protein
MVPGPKIIRLRIDKQGIFDVKKTKQIKISTSGNSRPAAQYIWNYMHQIEPCQSGWDRLPDFRNCPPARTVGQDTGYPAFRDYSDLRHGDYHRYFNRNRFNQKNVRTGIQQITEYKQQLNNQNRAYKQRGGKP